MRHRVLKWAFFVLSQFWCCRFYTLDADWFVAWWHVLCCLLITGKYTGLRMSRSDVCFVCPAWLYELLVGTLISRTNAYAGCSTLNAIKRFDLGHSIPTAKPLHVRSQCTCMHRMSTSLAWIWTRRCFVLIVLSYIVLLFYVTQVKGQKILLLLRNSLILSSDFVVIIICCLAMNDKTRW